jgi:hypothetical protein
MEEASSFFELDGLPADLRMAAEPHTRGNPPPVAPLQLALRFGLEVMAVWALGAGASQLGPPEWRLLLGLGGGALVVGLWVTFAVKGDPSRSGNAPVPVPGAVRLALELAIFVGGAAVLAGRGDWLLAAADLGAIVAHHAATRARVRWLLQQ